MRVLYHPGEGGPPEQGSAVTIGAFDGVHIGHRQVIERVKKTAGEQGLASAVVTFDRHPATVVRPESAPRLLTDLEQKIELLAAAGLDAALVVRFDAQRAREAAEDFVEEVLVGRLRARAVIVGHDFHFGHKRRGNVALLQAMGAELGFDVTGLRLFGDSGSGEVVSSTRIRRLIAEGEVEQAAELLGRLHQVRGIVARGDGRGRQLGFPTANVEVPASIALPAEGVYAGWYLRPGGSRLPAAVSLGRRPTFYAEGESQDPAATAVLEAYLLDFSGNLYGEPARVEFSKRLRAQERFSSSGELVEQMRSDVAETRRVLGLPG